MHLLLYALFFVSGAAALVYQVAWVRSLSLVFGGSHLAVTTVLAVFMGGMALGSALLGPRADRSARPLRLYGLLELGIAASAAAFLLLMEVYPGVYGPLARLVGDGRAPLTTLRVALAVVATIVPTTLMGGTLPVLSRLFSRRSASVGRHLSFLYGFNTLGAVVGALGAGFVLLRTLGVTRTVGFAIAANVAVGLAAVLLSGRWSAAEAPARGGDAREASPGSGAPAMDPRLARLVLWGIGVSGFCALGYEVLWTRMLAIVVGTSVYGFTLMLVAFLTGIALGSAAFALTQRAERPWPARRLVVAFGAVELAIAAAALAVTIGMRDLPTLATRLQGLFAGAAGEFGARQGASFVVAIGYMFVPAFLMGVAFPLAGTIHALGRRAIGGAVGEVLTYNTVGAILGSAISGFVLVYAFGAERSLQMLAVLNAAAGAAACLAVLGRRWTTWAVAAAAAALLVARAAAPDWGRAWDPRYFAIFRNNQRAAFDAPAKIRDALANTDVLYWHEGVNETISVIRPRGSVQAFIVNGRPEATTTPADVQCQRTLGHLPMLLHPAPRSVFVLGTGTGMTLGSTSVHPGVERIVLAELEPGVLGATRTFAEWNHGVLDDPRLRIVLNDGRNFLATTEERFDVITADPIHPWSGGAAYLYTAEYFRTVARHLKPGGVAAQWLPLYELDPRDVRTVVRTFAQSFRHVMVWLTWFDAELVGSDAPFVLDEAALARRISEPAIARDLEAVQMGSAEEFLSYFVLGTEGARAFGAGGVVNTDDNLFLEFSAPESMGVASLQGDNVAALAAAREPLAPRLAAPASEEERRAQAARWERNERAARLHDRAHSLFLWGDDRSPDFARAEAALARDFPDYGPYRFLARELGRARAATPRLADRAGFPVLSDAGTQRLLQISAVTMRVGETRAAVVFVDDDRRDVYGERYLDGGGEELDLAVRRFAGDALAALRASYAEAAAEARSAGEGLPREKVVAERLRARVATLTAEVPP